MKTSLMAWSLVSLFSLSYAGPSDNSIHAESNTGNDENILVKRAGKEDPDAPTVFNDLEVPPMKVLTPENFEETVKDGYW